MERSQWRVSTEVKEGDSSDEGNELETQFPREQSGTSSTERIPARSIVRKWIRERTRVCVTYIYICISQVFTGGKRVDEAETFHRSCPPSFHPGLSKRNRTSGHQASSEFLHVNWNAGSIDRIFHPLPLPRPPSSANWEKHFPPMEFGDFLSPLSRPRKSFLPLDVFIQLFLKCFPTEPNLTRLLIS